MVMNMSACTGPVLGICVVIVTAMFASNIPHSAIFKYSHSYSEIMKQAKSKNSERVEKSLHYIYTRKEPMQIIPPFSEASNLDLLVVVVTVAREKSQREDKNGYLFQTVTSMDKLMKRDHYFKKKAMVICNVNDNPDEHEDAAELQSYLPFMNKGGKNNLGLNFTVVPELQNCGLTDSARRKEIIDYAFCLITSRLIHHRYVLVLEDDVIPYDDLFEVLHHTLKYRLSDKKQFSFLKLYYPTRWQGYALEVDRILELISIGTLGGAFFLMIAYCSGHVLPRHRNVKTNVSSFYISGFLCFIIVVKLLGRVQVSELRRFTPQISKLGPSPESCTQAMLYKRETLQHLVQHIIVNNSLNKDLAISDFAKKYKIPGYSIEPNLFAHTGMQTSLSSEVKEPDEFLFDMPFLE